MPFLFKVACSRCSFAPVVEVVDGNMQEVLNLTMAFTDWATELDEEVGLAEEDEDGDPAEGTHPQQLLPEWVAPGGYFAAECWMWPGWVDIIVSGLFGALRPTVRFKPAPKRAPPFITHANRPSEMRLKDFGAGTRILSTPPSPAVQRLVRDELQSAWVEMVAHNEVDLTVCQVPGPAASKAFGIFSAAAAKQLDEDVHRGRWSASYCTSLQGLGPTDQARFLQAMAARFKTDPSGCHKCDQDSRGHDGGNLTSNCACSSGITVGELLDPHRLTWAYHIRLPALTLPGVESLEAASQQLADRERTSSVSWFVVGPNRLVTPQVIAYDGGCQLAVCIQSCGPLV